MAALLDRTLTRLRGEVVLQVRTSLPPLARAVRPLTPPSCPQIGPSSLSGTSTSALLDTPEPKAALDPAAAVLAAQQVDTVLSTLRQAAANLNSDVTVLHNPCDQQGKPKADEGVKLTTTASAVNDAETATRWRAKALRILVRRRPEGAEELLESRIAVVGNVDAGKSSLLGVLTRGRLDDGRGRARVSLFRHKHEAESGRTSSIGNEIVGWDARGEIIVPAEHMSVQAIWETTASKVRQLALLALSPRR